MSLKVKLSKLLPALPEANESDLEAWSRLIRSHLSMVYQVMLLSLLFVKQEMVKKTLKKTLHHYMLAHGLILSGARISAVKKMIKFGFYIFRRTTFEGLLTITIHKT